MIAGSFTQYKALFKALPQVAKALTSTLTPNSTASHPVKGERKLPITLAPMTDFNVAVSTQRSFGTVQLPFAECRALGVNDSMIHEDFMIGSQDMMIDAVGADGKTVPIFRDGNWAF